jgi:hypothetical protein
MRKGRCAARDDWHVLGVAANIGAVLGLSDRDWEVGMTTHKVLPQKAGSLMSTAGGFETWMQYVDGFKLRHFCGFELLDDPRGLSCLRDYHRRVVEAAVANGFGMINEGLHYRASRDWGELVGYSREALREINIRASSSIVISCANMPAPIRRCWSAA